MCARGRLTESVCGTEGPTPSVAAFGGATSLKEGGFGAHVIKSGAPPEAVTEGFRLQNPGTRGDGRLITAPT